MIASFLFKHKCFFVKRELRIHNLIFALNAMFNQNRNKRSLHMDNEITGEKAYCSKSKQ